jgi:hypothetical protein
MMTFNASQPVTFSNNRTLEASLKRIADRAARPTEDELNELYLTVSGWTKTTLDGINDAWEDPQSGGCYFFEHALEMQEGRELAASR